MSSFLKTVRSNRNTEHSLLKAKLNQVLFMRSLGYEIPEKESVLLQLGTKYTYTEFLKVIEQYKTRLFKTKGYKASYGSQVVREGLEMQYVRKPGTKHESNACVFFIGDEENKVNKSMVTQVITKIAEYQTSEDDEDVVEYDYVLIIYHGVLVSKKEILGMIENNEIIEMMDEKTFYTVPLSHYLSQPAIRLNSKQKEKLLVDLDTTPDRLPKILSTDPVVLYNGWQVGDIIMFARYDPHTGGPECRIAYRCVSYPPTLDV